MVKRSVEQMNPEAPELELAPWDGDNQEERDFILMLFRDTVASREQDERTIAERAKNWEADRIALSDMLLMRMALAEVRGFDQIPVKVTFTTFTNDSTKHTIEGQVENLGAKPKNVALAVQFLDKAGNVVATRFSAWSPTTSWYSW